MYYYYNNNIYTSIINLKNDEDFNYKLILKIDVLSITNETMVQDIKIKYFISELLNFLDEIKEKYAIIRYNFYKNKDKCFSINILISKDIDFLLDFLNIFFRKSNFKLRFKILDFNFFKKEYLDYCIKKFIKEEFDFFNIKYYLHFYINLYTSNNKNILNIINSNKLIKELIISFDVKLKKRYNNLEIDFNKLNIDRRFTLLHLNAKIDFYKKAILKILFKDKILLNNIKIEKFEIKDIFEYIKKLDKDNQKKININVDENEIIENNLEKEDEFILSENLDKYELYLIELIKNKFKEIDDNYLNLEKKCKFLEDVFNVFRARKFKRDQISRKKIALNKSKQVDFVPKNVKEIKDDDDFGNIVKITFNDKEDEIKYNLYSNSLYEKILIQLNNKVKLIFDINLNFNSNQDYILLLNNFYKKENLIYEEFLKYFLILEENYSNIIFSLEEIFNYIHYFLIKNQLFLFKENNFLNYLFEVKEKDFQNQKFWKIYKHHFTFFNNEIKNDIILYFNVFEKIFKVFYLNDFLLNDIILKYISFDTFKEKRNNFNKILEERRIYSLSALLAQKIGKHNVKDLNLNFDDLIKKQKIKFLEQQILLKLNLNKELLINDQISHLTKNNRLRLLEKKIKSLEFSDIRFKIDNHIKYLKNIILEKKYNSLKEIVLNTFNQDILNSILENNKTSENVTFINIYLRDLSKYYIAFKDKLKNLRESLKNIEEEIYLNFFKSYLQEYLFKYVFKDDLIFFQFLNENNKNLFQFNEFEDNKINKSLIFIDFINNYIKNPTDKKIILFNKKIQNIIKYLLDFFNTNNLINVKELLVKDINKMEYQLTEKKLQFLQNYVLNINDKTLIDHFDIYFKKLNINFLHERINSFFFHLKKVLDNNSILQIENILNNFEEEFKDEKIKFFESILIEKLNLNNINEILTYVYTEDKLNSFNEKLETKDFEYMADDDKLRSLKTQLKRNLNSVDSFIFIENNLTLIENSLNTERINFLILKIKENFDSELPLKNRLMHINVGEYNLNLFFLMNELKKIFMGFNFYVINFIYYNNFISTDLNLNFKLYSSKNEVETLNNFINTSLNIYIKDLNLLDSLLNKLDIIIKEVVDLINPFLILLDYKEFSEEYFYYIDENMLNFYNKYLNVDNEEFQKLKNTNEYAIRTHFDRIIFTIKQVKSIFFSYFSNVHNQKLIILKLFNINQENITFFDLYFLIFFLKIEINFKIDILKDLQEKSKNLVIEQYNIDNFDKNQAYKKKYLNDNFSPINFK